MALTAVESYIPGRGSPEMLRTRRHAPDVVSLGCARLHLRVFLLLQKRQNFFNQGVCRQAVFFAKNRNGSVLDKLVGPADADDRRVDHLGMEMLHDRAAKAIVQNMVLDRADDFDTTREEFQGAGIERLDPARIDQRYGDPLLLEFFRGFLSNLKHVAEPEDGDVPSMLDHLGFSDLEKLWGGFWNGAGAGSAGITDRDRTRIIICDRPKHVDEFIFILRLHVDDVWHVPQIPDIEQAVVGRSVVAAQARAVHAK